MIQRNDRTYHFRGWGFGPSEDPGVLKLSEARHVGAGVNAGVVVVISVQQVVGAGRFERECDLKFTQTEGCVGKYLKFREIIMTNG